MIGATPKCFEKGTMLVRAARPLSRVALTRSFQASAGRFAEPATSDEDKMFLTFALPHQFILDKEEVESVVLPGVNGEFGVDPGHTAHIAQLKSGEVQIFHVGQSEPERFFIPGGFAFTHENGVTDLSCPEAVKLEDIDTALVRDALAKAQTAYDAAAEDSLEKAQAQITVELYEEMQLVLNM